MQRSRVLRSIGSAAAGALLAGAVASCGGGGTATTGAITKAADVSSATPGYRIALDEHLTSSSLPAPLAITGTGSIDSQQKAGKLSFDTSGSSSLAQSGAGHVEAIFQGFTFYMRVPPALAQRLPGHKAWMKLDINRAGQAAGIDLSSLSNLNTSDPSQFLRYLKTVGGGTQKVGSEQVRGIQTTHYKATLDLDRYPSLVPASERQQAQASIAALEKLTNLHKIPVEVWIDGQQLVRRMRMAFSETTPSGPLSLDMTMDLFSFGPQPAVRIPAASSVFDATQLASQGLKAKAK